MVQEGPKTPRKRLVNLNDSVSQLSSRRSIISSRVNNDDEERKQHRIEAELETKLANISISKLNTSAGPTVNLQDHFNTCLQMFTANKINTKNVWNLNILDYMTTVVHGNAEVRDILQVASTTLDIGTKIYSLRVDDIYADVLKLTNALTNININEQNDSENDSQNEDTDTKTVRKKKTKNKINSEEKLTISPEEALNAPLKKNNALFNQCTDSTDTNSLLNMTLMKKPGCSFDLLIKEEIKKHSWHEPAQQSPVMPEVLLLSRDLLEPISSIGICPTFSGFAVDKWDAENDEDNFKVHNIKQVECNDDGVFNPYLDPDLDENEADISDMTQGSYDKNPVESVYITDMKPISGGPSGPLEYSYRPLPNICENFNIVGVWAGPAHWKTKFLRKHEEKTEDSAPKLQKPRRIIGKKFKPFIYQKISVEDLKEALSNSGNRKTCYGSMSNKFNSCTLPENMDIEKEGISLMNRPRYKVYRRIKQTIDVNLNISHYEYNNPNDNEYCNETVDKNNWNSNEHVSELQNNGCTAEGDEVSDNNDQNDSLNQEVDTNNDSLISCPTDLVSPIFMQYAQTAKKMDMKKLKTAMWGEFTKNNKNNEMNEDNATAILKSTTLSSIYNELPNNISSTMAENLNGPLAFVALLHLANEQSLELQGTDDLSDIIIKKSFDN